MSYLKNFQLFKEVLDKYRVSEAAKETLAGLRMVLIVAPTASGKNTVIKRLLETGEYSFIVSDTTRSPQVRDGAMEQNGIQYYFRSESEVLADLKDGKFLEAAFYANNVYGISIRELERIRLMNKIAITDIEIVGTHNVMTAKPDAKAIFLIPPSYEEWMNRLQARGKMEKSEIRNRLATAEKEFQAALTHDYYNFLITDDVDRSAEIISGILEGRPSPHQAEGRQLVNELLTRLQADLEDN